MRKKYYFLFLIKLSNLFLIETKWNEIAKIPGNNELRQLTEYFK